MTRVPFETVRPFSRRAAAPEGGADARKCVVFRGCVLGLAMIWTTCAAADPLPSGQTVELMELRSDEVSGETWLRFRFLAPAIAREGGTVDFAGAEGDMAHLCQTVALEHLAETGVSADRIVVSLSDRVVDFGVADADATQYFDAFRVEDGRCIWEGF